MIVQRVQALVFSEKWENALTLSICFESMKMSDYSAWAFERIVGFTNTSFLSSFTGKMFKQKTRV